MKNERLDNATLEERLRSAPPVREAPIGFTERVMAHLANAPVRERSVPERRFAFLPRFAIALAVVTVAAVGAFQFLRNSPPSTSLASNDLPETPDLEIKIPEITSEQVQALTLKLDQPLEKELEYVISDTRQAIQFVASNFLPEK